MASTPSAIASMVLPVPIGSGQDHVLGAADELAARQLQQLRPRDALERRPVELVEGLDVGKARLAQQAARGALTAVGDLGFEQFAQQILVGPAAVAGAPAKRRILTHHCRELEFLAVLLDDRLARAPYSWLPPAVNSRWS